MKNVNNQELYKRNQVEESLWKIFDKMSSGNVHRPVPKQFLTRIKRLLEIDRELFVQSDHFRQLAFSAKSFYGKGRETFFEAFDIFCLGVGLDLLSMGFKQGEVVFLIQYIRNDLEKVFQEIKKHPISLRFSVLPKDAPSRPTCLFDTGEEADLSCFMIVRKVEIGESLFDQFQNSLDPIIFHPDICWGQEELKKKLTRLGISYHSVIVMELQNLAALLLENLKKIPAIRRGRKSLKEQSNETSSKA